MEDRIMSCVIILIILGVCAAVVIPFNFVTRAGGEHVGYVTAVEDNRRILFPDNTTTVYVKTELSSSQEDTYCVQDWDNGLIEDLKEAARNKENVVIKFEGRSMTGLFNCKGDVIVGVENRN